jgi:transposase
VVYRAGMRRPGSLAEWEHKRLIAANMFELGLEARVIAASLGVDEQTVRAWRRKFAAGGRAALRSGHSGGRPSRLDDDQKARLGELLLTTPAECGFGKYLWTQQLIAELIEREFAVSYHHDHVGVILKELEFTHQKPARRARERDEQAIQAWRRQAWPALLKKAPAPAG